MSYVLRSARVAYDNVAIGSATGRERTILASAPSTENHGGGSNVAIASSEPSTDNDYARDRIITNAAGTGKTTLCPKEYPVNQN